MIYLVSLFVESKLFDSFLTTTEGCVRFRQLQTYTVIFEKSNIVYSHSPRMKKTIVSVSMNMPSEFLVHRSWNSI